MLYAVLYHHGSFAEFGASNTHSTSGDLNMRDLGTFVGFAMGTPSALLLAAIGANKADIAR